MILDAYEFMRQQADSGVICAAIPAQTDDGQPILWMTSVEYLGDQEDSTRAFIAAVASLRRAYREAHRHGIDTLV